MSGAVNNFNIVFYGAGAIGATLGGWLTQEYDHVYLLARGDNAEAMKSKGLILYEKANTNPPPIKVKVIEDLTELPSIDIVVITVKNYDLEEVAKDISTKIGDKPIIVALQNGIENQKILPKYFSKIIYGVIVLSAWRDKPSVFGNRGKGQITLGTIDNKQRDLLRTISNVFKLGFPTKITNRLQDAAHSKLILNLLNSVFTLISPELQNDDEIYKIIKILAYVFLEGIKIAQTAGYKEHKLFNLPSWNVWEMVLTANKNTVLNMFKKDLKFYFFNSMAQDMVLQQKNQSELESLNGYLLSLADSYDVEVPINRLIYRLCKEEFVKTPFKPLSVNYVWEKINKNLKENL